MKKLVQILILTITVFNIETVLVNAQAPNGIPYQAVARDNNGNLIANQNISLRFSIHDSTTTGTVIYKETQTATTNTLGLFSVSIGVGTVETGTFASINWGSGAKFTQVEMDASGGNAYIDMGTQQMLSVPYALYAEKSGSSTVETDPKVGSLSSNKIPKWNGSTLEDGVVTDDGTNVGIGTSAPHAILQISNEVANRRIVLWEDDDDDHQYYGFGINGGALRYQVSSPGSSHVFYSGSSTGASTELMRIKGNGNIGIGTSTPSNKLTVSGNADITGNVGIGTSSPSQKLDVNGITKTTNLQLTNGSGAGKILQSDASGNASWVNSSSISVTETDPKVGALSSNKIPKWNGSTLTDGVVTDNGTNVGIGQINPVIKLQVGGPGGGEFGLSGSNVSPNAGYIRFGDNSGWKMHIGRARESIVASINSDITGALMTIQDNGNVGIGITSPSQKLEVNGTAKTTNLIMTSGAGAGKILTSDGSGNGSWTNPAGAVNFRLSGIAQSGSYNTVFLSWNAVDFANNCTAGGGSFTAPGSGIYHLQAQVAVYSNTYSSSVGIELYRNGSSALGAIQSVNAFSYQTLVVADNISLNSGDVITVKYTGTSNANIIYLLSSDFSGFKIH